jgi:cytochrome P450
VSSGLAARPLPGPRGVAFPRRFLAFRREPLSFLTRLARDYGDVAAARLGPRTIVLVSDPELIREILVVRGREFIKSQALERARLLLGEGLLTSEGELHLRERRMIQPAFHRERIAGYGRAMTGLSARFGAGWRAGQVVDMAVEMMRLTLAVVGRTLFGADVEAEAAEISAALTDAMGLMGRVTNPLAPLLDRLPLPATRRFQRARARLDGTIYRLIGERRARAATGEAEGDLLSLLLSARDPEGGGPLNDLQLRDEALTLFLAGHETTANALAWTWYLLARNPEAEDRLHDELDTVLDGRPATVEDYGRLPYTVRVLTESMRLYPPAWAVGRQALKPLEIGGYALPARQPILMAQWVVHRDPRWFPGPENFDPDRWLPEREAALPRFAYFPFGGGTRKCIGESFAWMEAVLVLATLARSWRPRLLPGPAVQPLPLITLRPLGGIPMRLERR